MVHTSGWNKDYRNKSVTPIYTAASIYRPLYESSGSVEFIMLIFHVYSPFTVCLKITPTRYPQ